VTAGKSVACPLCSGPMTRCELLDPQTRFPLLCCGMEKPGFFEITTGPRKINTGLLHRLCVDCGYIMAFAAQPELFREELPGEAGAASALPIPHENEEGKDGS
jgi:hypothetical protein